MYALVAACGLECIEARNIQFVDFCPPDKARESGILSKITCTVWLPDQLVSGLKVSPYIYLQKNRWHKTNSTKNNRRFSCLLYTKSSIKYSIVIANRTVGTSSRINRLTFSTKWTSNFNKIKQWSHSKTTYSFTCSLAHSLTHSHSPTHPTQSHACLLKIPWRLPKVNKIVMSKSRELQYLTIPLPVHWPVPALIISIIPI